MLGVKPGGIAASAASMTEAVLPASAIPISGRTKSTCCSRSGVDYREELLLDDVRGFNEHLLSYLACYNGERPHWGLGYLTPCQALAGLNPNLSSMW